MSKFSVTLYYMFAKHTATVYAEDHADALNKVRAAQKFAGDLREEVTGPDVREIN